MPRKRNRRMIESISFDLNFNPESTTDSESKSKLLKAPRHSSHSDDKCGHHLNQIPDPIFPNDISNDSSKYEQQHQAQTETENDNHQTQSQSQDFHHHEGIIQISGASGSGKTQLCLQLSIDFVLQQLLQLQNNHDHGHHPKSSKSKMVYFLHTKGKLGFPLERLESIMKVVIKENYNDLITMSTESESPSDSESDVEMFVDYQEVNKESKAKKQKLDSGPGAQSSESQYVSQDQDVTALANALLSNILIKHVSAVTDLVDILENDLLPVLRNDTKADVLLILDCLAGLDMTQPGLQQPESANNTRSSSRQQQSSQQRGHQQQQQFQSCHPKQILFQISSLLKQIETSGFRENGYNYDQYYFRKVVVTNNVVQGDDVENSLGGSLSFKKTQQNSFKNKNHFQWLTRPALGLSWSYCPRTMISLWRKNDNTVYNPSRTDLVKYYSKSGSDNLNSDFESFDGMYFLEKHAQTENINSGISNYGFYSIRSTGFCAPEMVKILPMLF